MAADDDPLRRVQPLTHSKLDGGRYERDPAVEAEIAAVLAISPMQLIAKSSVRDEQSPHFIREETLAYFIRAYQAAGNVGVVTKVTEALLARWSHRIRRRLRALGLRQQDADDAYYDVVRVVITAITDLASDRGDFYQVRFARALKLKVLSAYDKQLREVERVQRQIHFNAAADTTEEEDEQGEFDRSTFSREAAELSRPDDDMLEEEEHAERRRLLDTVIGTIQDPRHREAFVLHKLEGWQITADDPQDPHCLVRYFRKKSPKTIYNWIKQAEADIAAAGFAAGREEDQ